MKKLLCIILIILSTAACKDNSKVEEFEQLQDKTMVIHDEVMAEMGKLMDLRSQLDQVSDSTTLEKRQNIKRQLEETHDKMMDWMADYTQKFPHGEKVTEEEVEAKTPILETELEEIKALKQETNEVIKQAEQLLHQ